jgi:RNA polymerase II-associated factor 1
MGVSIMRDQNLKKQLMDTSREGQIKIIEHSFLAASKVNLLNLRHPTKPNVKAAEIIPVFPDFENWPNVYALSSFDEDPTNKTSNKVAKVGHGFSGSDFLKKLT